MFSFGGLINVALGVHNSNQLSSPQKADRGSLVLQQTLSSFKVNNEALSNSEPTVSAQSQPVVNIVQTALATISKGAEASKPSKKIVDQVSDVLYTLSLPTQKSTITALATIPSSVSNQAQTVSQGDAILEKVLAQYKTDKAFSRVTNRGSEVVQTALMLYEKQPVVIKPKQAIKSTGTLGRIVHWFKGTIPQEDASKAIIERAVTKASQGKMPSVKIGEKVVAQALNQHNENQCSLLEHLIGETEKTVSKDLSPSSNYPVVQKVLMIGIAIAVTLFAVQKLWNQYGKNTKELSIENVPVEANTAQPVIEEPKEELVQEEEFHVLLQLTPEQVMKLQRFIVLMNQSPDLQMAFTRLLHQQLCLKRSDSCNDVKNDNTHNGS